jgi:hypothetical protein
VFQAGEEWRIPYFGAGVGGSWDFSSRVAIPIAPVHDSAITGIDPADPGMVRADIKGP